MKGKKEMVGRRKQMRKGNKRRKRSRIFFFLLYLKWKNRPKLNVLFPGAENMERIVFTIIQGAVDFPDPIAQKTCFIILTKLVELWGESETWPRQEVVSCEQEARFLSLPAGQYRVWASLWALLLLQEVKTAWWASPTLSTNTSSQPVSWLPSNRPLTCQMHRRSWWVSLIPPLIKEKSRFGDKPQLFSFFQVLSECALTLKMIHLKRVKICFCGWPSFVMCHRASTWTRAVFVSGTRIHPVLAAGVPAITPGGPGNFTGQKSLNPDVQKYLETCSFIYVQFYSFQSVSLFKYV